MTETLISSLDIIARTGISRQTLNNYIRWGLLPKPQVRKPDDPAARARQLGYFDASAVSIIQSVKSLKTQGHSMTEIKRRLIGGPSFDEQSHPDASAAKPAKLQAENAYREQSPESRQASLFDEDADKLDEENIATYENIKEISKVESEAQHFCVLAATLKDAARLRAELSPRDYFKLWESFWKAGRDIARDFSARWLVREESSIIMYFLMDDGPDVPGRVVTGALKLLEQAAKLGTYSQDDSYSMKDIGISIGIHTGYDCLAVLPERSGVQVIDAGPTSEVARLISQYAPVGTVWSSKAVITLFPEAERQRIRFGIRSAGMFHPERFIRPGDHPAGEKTDIFRDYHSLAHLPVTEIIGRT